MVIPAIPPPRKHPHLYELNTWAWLDDLSARSGRAVRLGSVPDEEWDKLQGVGFDFVWLMGVWRRSAAGRKIQRIDVGLFPAYDTALPGWSVDDVVGSPYSIQDYTPDPHLGSWDDLDAARDALNRRGIRLILDFVPNHTGPDHPWITAHPEYYIQGALADFRRNPSGFFLAERDDRARWIARGKDPYFPPWPDTAQLNYFNPVTREAMLDVLRSIARHADGARCDMAMLSLNEIFRRTWAPLVGGVPQPTDEFWSAAVAALPGFTWIGEVYWDLEWRLQQLGLTFTYDKRFYDRLRSGSPGDLRAHLRAASDYQARLVRFLENHDEPRCAEVFGKEKLPAAATLAATLPGMRFYHQGQLEGKKLHLPIQLRRAAPDAPDPSIQALYAKLLKISDEAVFHQGEWKLLDCRACGDASFDNLIAYQWRTGAAWKLIVVNLSAGASRGSVPIGDGALWQGRRAIVDQLNGLNLEVDGEEMARNGLAISLGAFGSRIFDLTGSGKL
ncbi:MAG: alpha-amylase family glycosyl hydrolase [Terriglobia bacterium]